jgi:hypothetical protein
MAKKVYVSDYPQIVFVLRDRAEHSFILLNDTDGILMIKNRLQ